MAITPTEAKRRIAPDARVVKQLEERIDTTILGMFRRGSNAAICDASIFPDVMTREHIMTRYRSAGWDVRYQSDQRDGDYLEFRPRKTRTYSDQRDALVYPYDR